MRSKNNKKSLSELFPELASEWHSSKNGSLTPEDVGPSSNKEVWWKCPKGKDHEWPASINNRTRGKGCPFCSGRRATMSNNLSALNPELSMQWHPTKNGNLKPTEVKPGSNREVWWKCFKEEDHEWPAVIANRVKGSGCPFCSGKRASKKYNLQILNPNLSKQWHPSNNGNLIPSEVTPGSTKKVWWKCPEGDDHEWDETVDNRNRGRGCPFCAGKRASKNNNLLITNPHLSKQWHPTNNGDLMPNMVTLGSTKKVWWKCPEGDDHEWDETINNRTRSRGCPFCAGKRASKDNNLGVLNPDLAEQWHPTKNGDLTPHEVTPGSSKKVWWKCPEEDDHEWDETVVNRMKGVGCPFCSGNRASTKYNLQIINPNLSKQWHPTNNGDLMPSMVTPGSSKKVWWKCPEGDDHEWDETVVNRNKGSGCPFCAGKRASKDNNLSVLNPDLAAQWHPSKNVGIKPNEVTPGSGLKVWWRCTKDSEHEWPAFIYHRVNGRGCPYCTLTPQSRQELIISFELANLFPEINPKGYKTKLDGKLYSIDIYIPELNIGIEFDGNYWHKEKIDLDKQKTLKLKEGGLNIIRIRQEPLEKIFETDIISKTPYNGKEITDNVLKHILTHYEIKQTTRDKINSYLKKNSLQNTKALDRYIDKILSEKG